MREERAFQAEDHADRAGLGSILLVVLLWAPKLSSSGNSCRCQCLTSASGRFITFQLQDPVGLLSVMRKENQEAQHKYS